MNGRSSPGMRAGPWAPVMLAVAVFAAGCGEDLPDTTPDPAETTTTDPTTTGPEIVRTDPEVSVVATNLEAPWDLAFTPDGRIFVTERDRGRVLEVLPGGETEEVQLLTVDAAGEGGLLGLAPSPEWEHDSLLYAYLTGPEDNRVVRFRPGEEPEAVLTGIAKGRVHNGGRIAFGPDGMLWVGTGDAAQPRLAPNPASLAGKILRMTPEGEPAPGNPFPGSLVYATGFRNVQGLAFDGDGRLYATDLGPDVDDEINLVEPGAYYGWPDVTGVADREGVVDPVAVRQPREASWSGAAILRSEAAGAWQGDLFAAGLRGARLWRFELAPDGSVAEIHELFVGDFGRLRHAAQAPDGSLWLLTSNRDGRGQPASDDDRIVRVLPPTR